MAMTPDVAYSLAMFVELLVHGIYTCLFIGAMIVMLKRRSSSSARSTAWIFLSAIILMYMVSTFHAILGIYRYIRAFIVVVEPQGALYYLFDFHRWDNNVNNVLLCVMTWLGDALVIYRCYFVWNSNIWVIMLPTLLLLSAIGINLYNIYWFIHPLNVNLAVGGALLDTVYPLAFVQNVMTTGLIALKIWTQYRASSASNVIDRGSRLSLIRILRIVVESAMIYTLQLFVLIILYFRDDTSQIIFQSAITPSTGIVFVLIAIRVHVAKSWNDMNSGIDCIPAWLEATDNITNVSQPAISPSASVAGTAGKLGGDEESGPFSLSSLKDQ